MRTRVLPACNRLGHLPPDEVEAKRRALAAVRPAFVLGRNASVERPFAAEFVLSETCHTARRIREQRRAAARPTAPPPKERPIAIAGGAHRRCTLWRAADADAADHRSGDKMIRERRTARARQVAGARQALAVEAFRQTLTG